MDQLRDVALTVAIISAGGNPVLLLAVLRDRVPDDWTMESLLRMVESFKAENVSAFVNPRQVLVSRPVRQASVSFHRPATRPIVAASDHRCEPQTIPVWSPKRLWAWLRDLVGLSDKVRPSGQHSGVGCESRNSADVARPCTGTVQKDRPGSETPAEAAGGGSTSSAPGEGDRVARLPLPAGDLADHGRPAQAGTLREPDPATGRGTAGSGIPASACFTRTVVMHCKGGRMLDSLGNDYGVCPKCCGMRRGDFETLVVAAGVRGA